MDQNLCNRFLFFFGKHSIKVSQTQIDWFRNDLFVLVAIDLVYLHAHHLQATATAKFSFKWFSLTEALKLVALVTGAYPTPVEWERRIVERGGQVSQSMSLDCICFIFKKIFFLTRMSARGQPCKSFQPHSFSFFL